MSGRVVKLCTKSDLPRIDEGVTGWDETLVEEGLYIVGYRRWRKVKQFGSERYIVEFQIVDGEHAGKIIARFIPKPQKCNRPAKRSNMYTDFTTIIGKRPPRAGLHRITPNQIFEGVQIEARVVTVERNHRGVELACATRYSRIGYFTKLVAGTPPWLRRNKGAPS